MRTKLSEMHQKMQQREKEFAEREAKLLSASGDEVGDLQRQLSSTSSQLSEAQQVRSLLTHVAHISPSHAVRPTAVLAFCA